MARIPGWLPDALTVSRLALLPGFVAAVEATRAAVIRGETSPPRWAALSLVIAIAATDKLDGYFARRSARGPTRHGAILDAVADRAVQWTGVLLLTFHGEPAFTPLPVWLPLCLAGREALLIATWLSTRGTGPTTVEHELHGRIATAALFGALIAAVWAAPGWMVGLLAALAGANVIYSAVRYAVRLQRHAVT
jgi:phosphatidylglycerophosphate synthase